MAQGCLCFLRNIAECFSRSSIEKGWLVTYHYAFLAANELPPNWGLVDWPAAMLGRDDSPTSKMQGAHARSVTLCWRAVRHLDHPFIRQKGFEFVKSFHVAARPSQFCDLMNKDWVGAHDFGFIAQVYCVNVGICDLWGVNGICNCADPSNPSY